MDLISTIIIGLLVAAIPLALFLALISLALLIWCWGRIGRYFINLGRWVGDWRNFVPMTILGTLYVVILMVLWRFVLPQAAIIWIILLVVHGLVTLVCLSFAAIAWTFWFHEWFWPLYRRWLWGVFAYLFGRGRARAGRTHPQQRARPKSAHEPPPGADRATRPPQGQKVSPLTSFWALMLGKSPQPRRTAIAARPGIASDQPMGGDTPRKASWLSALWALAVGKPQPNRRQPAPTRVATTEQSLRRTGSRTADGGVEAGLAEKRRPADVPARGQKRAKRSWFNSFWTIMLGKPEPKRAQATAAARGEKPKKQGFFADVVHKVGAGIEWIRVRLNLD